jgi:diguanylate cyclase (GGDEF)-like protein
LGTPRYSNTPTLVGPELHIDKRRLDHRFAVTLPALRVVAGEDMLRFVTFNPADHRVIIGREPTCELPLTDASVSRNHAVVEVDADGELWVEDLGSTNGTAVDGDPVTSRRPLPIGSTLMVGGVVLKLDRLSLKELCHLKRVAERLSVADKDPLTGLATRRYIDEELEGMLSRHETSGVPISVLFLDIDHFKRVNDNWGHAVGDDVLRAVSRLMVIHLRDSDTCVRYGGEELVAVLPNCDLESAVRTADRLRREIRDHAWDSYGEELAVTASMGVATARPGESCADWLKRADTALYAAKNGGRDRVCASGGQR